MLLIRRVTFYFLPLLSSSSSSFFRLPFRHIICENRIVHINQSGVLFENNIWTNEYKLHTWIQKWMWIAREKERKWKRAKICKRLMFILQRDKPFSNVSIKFNSIFGCVRAFFRFIPHFSLCSYMERKRERRKLPLKMCYWNVCSIRSFNVDLWVFLYEVRERFGRYISRHSYHNRFFFAGRIRRSRFFVCLCKCV